MEGGESFNGYATNNKKGALTQIRIDRKSPKYLDIRDYKVERNYLGRRDKVHLLSVRDSVRLIAETEAFEQALNVAVNQGPLLIVIEIDTTGGRVDLALQIAQAITKTDNCTTVAFISAAKFGGAFAEGAIIALACDKVYISENATIGGASYYTASTEDTTLPPIDYAEPVNAEAISAWEQYVAEMADKRGPSGVLVKAMADENIEVVEMNDDGSLVVAEHRSVTSKKTIVRTLSERGSLLKLSASQAELYGVADKRVASLDELLTTLRAGKVRRVRDTRVSRARLVLERGWKAINRTLTAINDLEERAETVTRELDTIEREISYLNEMSLRRNYGILLNERGRLLELGMTFDEWVALLAYHDRLLDELIGVTARLIREYNRLIPTARKYPDLRALVSILEDRAESARGANNDALSRFRLGY
jgi:tetratricopeptide (TPR) repeat protein